MQPTVGQLFYTTELCRKNLPGHDSVHIPMGDERSLRNGSSNLNSRAVKGISRSDIIGSIPSEGKS